MRHREGRGQSLVEFALVLPVLMLMLGGVVQAGSYLWASNTLTQIANDTGRWAATQPTCGDVSAVVQRANTIADETLLVGYTRDMWTTANVTASWPPHASDPCPTTSNAQFRYVQIRIEHPVPVFFPVIPFPRTVTAAAEFRMEPSSA